MKATLNLSNSVVEGTCVLAQVPEAIRQVAIMLAPAANTFGMMAYSQSATCCDPLTAFAAYWNIFRSLPRVHPARNIMEDSYLRHEIEAVVSWLWPIPSAKSIEEAKPLFLQRIEHLMQKQIVRIYNLH